MIPDVMQLLDEWAAEMRGEMGDDERAILYGCAGISYELADNQRRRKILVNLEYCYRHLGGRRMNQPF